MDLLGDAHTFASLSVKDLLKARDQYHWQLLNKRNVVGTAVGLYRIRHDDPWPKADDSHTAAAMQSVVQVKPVRTLDNSEVRDYSWPCVLVFVNDWLEADRFGPKADQVSPEELVPKTLYMSDGRAVPVCVVKVEEGSADETVLPSRSWPHGRIGGGFPLVSTVQGEENLASVGTLVTDGHTVYALTSRHVAGPHGHQVSSILRGKTIEVGISSTLQLSRRPFSEVYANFPSRQTYLTLDAGLIEVNTVSEWTSRTFGLGKTGPLADLNELNISTRLVGARVKAFGAASGILQGTIAALFYRYRSVGGWDNITDILIAPEPGTQSTRPGDSGTIWHLIDGQVLRPAAAEWGGQTFLADSGTHHNFALAVNLSNILRLLNVDLVADYNTGAQPYWGKTGHYTIGALATEHVASKKLGTFLQANIDRISFSVERLSPTTIDKTTIAEKKAGAFVPLADVPDLIWKNMPKKVKGGRDTAREQGPEHPCHFADIDKPRPSDNKTLRQICVTDTTNVDVAVWQEYYTQVGNTTSASRGLLPFRVWQFFDAMVAAVKAKDIDSYLAAAGLVAHYVGDASQPLHGSFMSNGLPGTGQRQGVHSAYEDTMVDRHDQEILAALGAAVKSAHVPAGVTTGRGAAIAVVELMDRAATKVAPKDLCDAYASVSTKDNDSSPAVTDALWTQFGKGTIANLADSILTLGMIWNSAWAVGEGKKSFSQSDLISRPTDHLLALYQDPTFVPSLNLDQVGAALTG